MKIRTFTFLALIASLSTVAQPTIHSVTNFASGMSFQFVDCQTAGFDPGSAGASVVWNYAALSPVDTAKDTCMINSGANYPGAGLLITEDLLQDTFFYDVQAMGSYLHGSLYPLSGLTVSYHNPIYYKRILSFGDSYVDSFAFTGTTPTQSASGVDTVVVDAWGTLTLPSGTYPDVIRIKAVSRYQDTVSSIPADVITIVYYWYDDLHVVPLLEWDSTYSTGFTPANVLRYLLKENDPPTTSSPLIAGKSLSVTGCFNGNNLLLNGDLEPGETYTVAVFNTSGQRIYSKEFVPAGRQVNFSAGANFAAGMYFVSIQHKGMNEKALIKVVKQ